MLELLSMVFLFAKRKISIFLLFLASLMLKQAVFYLNSLIGNRLGVPISISLDENSN